MILIAIGWLWFQYPWFVLMLTQTGFSTSLGQPQLGLFTVEQRDVGAPLAEPVKAPCRTSEKLMSVLEEITGWKAEFEESAASYRSRSQAGAENQPAQGTFSIVDMSADWPANQRTGHRGKCDQLVSLVGDLIGELQTAKLELSRVRSVMAVLPSDSAVALDDEVLVDSFVPKFDRVETGNVRFDAQNACCPSNTDCDDEFEVHQDLGESGGTLVSPPFAGWSLGGATGIVENTYLDWLVDGQERIAITVGKIESTYSDGDLRTVLEVEPLTSEFRVSTRGEIEVFYHLDVAGARIDRVKPSQQWTRLGVGEAIIASTNEDLDLAVVLSELQSQPRAQFDADTIAQAVSRANGSSQRSLVLKREQA